MVKFAYSAAGEITGVIDVFHAFRQPTIAIPAEVTAITGITDALVAGHTIDDGAVASFAAGSHIIIAHNAGFDRKFAERFWLLFTDKHWACSMFEIDWKAHGLAGARLSYLLANVGLFHDAHRAVDDCHALLEILARPLGASEQTGLGALLGRAHTKQNAETLLCGSVPRSGRAVVIPKSTLIRSQALAGQRATGAAHHLKR